METTTMIVNAVLVAFFPIAVCALPAVKAFFGHVPTPRYTTADFELAFDRYAEERASEGYKGEK
jgi:hypothetical protein